MGPLRAGRWPGSLLHSMYMALSNIDPLDILAWARQFNAGSESRMVRAEEGDGDMLTGMAAVCSFDSPCLGAIMLDVYNSCLHA